MNKPDTRRVKMTKQLLKDSLIELIQQKPVGKITIKELCENADINRSTFYLYYSDPFSLLQEIEADLVDHIRCPLEQIKADQGTIAYLVTLLTYIKEHHEIFKALLHCQESLLFQTSFTTLARNTLDHTLPSSIHPPLSPYVNDFLLMGSISAIKRWIESDYSIPPNDLATLLYHMADGACHAI